jgi:hypothetical protein
MKEEIEMLWTLLIWVVVGLVMMSMVWPIAVLVRAAMHKYDLELYLDAMDAVLEEYDAEMEAKYNRFVLAMKAAFHNAMWPYKLIWLTRKFIPRFDDRYVDLVLEKLDEGEHA